MVQIYRANAGLVPLVLLVTVVGLIVATVVLRRRITRSGDRRSSIVRTLLDVVVVGNLIGYALLTLPPGHGQAHSLNLIPFAEIYEISRSDSGATAPVVEVIGNAVLLMPFAAVAGLRWKALDTMRATVTTVFCIALVTEVTQFGLGLGRVASTTDVLLPVLGAVVARGVFQVVRRSSTTRASEPSSRRPDRSSR